uniref:Uncharacterized protein n=1 Tax=Mimivirus LCMiAC01 TaxID=2506608 RepID=A0A481Z0C8_9VIRU|nr:MAG: hypothetical protein LCMiAC01_05610 [Mimivirus LCMiAC01]
MTEIFKNPIIIGILAAGLTYLYLYWDAEKRYKAKPKLQRKPVSIFIPGVVGIIAWFLVSGFFEEEINYSNKMNTNVFVNNPNDVATGSMDLHLLQKGTVKLPHADVFIDLAKFN